MVKLSSMTKVDQSRQETTPREDLQEVGHLKKNLIKDAYLNLEHKKSLLMDLGKRNKVP